MPPRGIKNEDTTKKLKNNENSGKSGLNLINSYIEKL
jgi:hypothetical protein